MIGGGGFIMDLCNIKRCDMEYYGCYYGLFDYLCFVLWYNYYCIKRLIWGRNNILYICIYYFFIVSGCIFLVEINSKFILIVFLN